MDLWYGTWIPNFWIPRNTMTPPLIRYIYRSLFRGADLMMLSTRSKSCSSMLASHHVDFGLIGSSMPCDQFTAHLINAEFSLTSAASLADETTAFFNL